MNSEALNEAVALAAQTGKATREQIEDLLSGERPRVRSVVELMSEADLEWALGTEVGEQALLNAFELMPAYYRPGSFTAPVTVRYKVSRTGATAVEQDVEFGPQSCRVSEVDTATEPNLRVFVNAIGFVKTATGLVRGMELMMRGDLKVQGDVQVAMKMETFFGLAESGAQQ